MMTARGTAILCIGLLIAQRPYAIAQQPQPPGTAPGAPQALLNPDELDSLVAPIALYPDPILSQVLVAATYPVEIVEAARWLEENHHLSGKALADAAAEQPWDASVQALVLLPEVLNRLNQEVRWTTDLGNAFLEQEEDVMDAIQRMREKASARGALRSTSQQTVSTKTENNQPFIVIEPASPNVVYVPVYNPVAVWGPPVVPFPAISYPPYTGIAAASALSFGAGMAVGAFWGGGWGGWGWNPGWGGRNIIVNNNFIRSNRFRRANVGAGNRWVRNPERRAGGRTGGRGAANRTANIRGGNRSSRPTVEQTRRRLNEAGRQRGGTGRPSQANVGQRGGRRAGQGSAARMNRGGEGQRARRGNAGQGVTNRTQQGRSAQARQNRGGNRQANRGAANRAASGAANRGGARSSVNRNRGAANRSAAGSRGGGGGARGGANRARGGGGGARGGANRARGGGGGGRRGGGRRR
jgi:hypothetical protein